jgi:hypothetical protein
LQIPVINIKVHIIAIISSPCQRQCDLLPSLGVRRSLTFLVTDSLISKTIFSSETAVSVHLAKGFQKRRFLEIDQSETRIACGGHVCYIAK